jgi:GNAT acetyltransferase-like protein/acetyltransferase (GNAT) family protein
VREAGWNQLGADWRIFLDLGTVYAVRDGNRLVATAATLPFDNRFAWISMVLVAGDHRRRGLATRLLRRCIDDLLARGLVPVLDATPAGRAVYRPLGFQDAWGFHRLMRAQEAEAARTLPEVAVRPIADAIWPALCRYDAGIFGADRSAVLSRLRGRLPAAELFAERDGEISGFLLGRDGRTTNQLGPLMAEDDASACALLAQAFGAIDGPLYLDLADARTNIAAWLGTRGFTPQRPFTRMLHGRAEKFDDGRRTYAVVGPEFG